MASFYAHYLRRLTDIFKANFTALNIEPDDQSDDEVDNTKELQVRSIPC